MHIIYFTHPVIASLDIPFFGKPKIGEDSFIIFFLPLFAAKEGRPSSEVGLSRWMMCLVRTKYIIL